MQYLAHPDSSCAMPGNAYPSPRTFLPFLPFSVSLFYLFLALPSFPFSLLLFPFPIRPLTYLSPSLSNYHSPSSLPPFVALPLPVLLPPTVFPLCSFTLTHLLQCPLHASQFGRQFPSRNKTWRFYLDIKVCQKFRASRGTPRAPKERDGLRN